MNDELSEAIQALDLARVESLLRAGANVRYVRPQGYSAMLDVMHGRLTIDSRMPTIEGCFWWAEPTGD